MLKTLLFDFGDVFLNLDKAATQRELKKLGMLQFSTEMEELNALYEKGRLTSEQFIDTYQAMFPGATKQQLINAWNAILLDFPEHRLHFIEQLAKTQKYRLLLLSNTNEIHIDWVKENIRVYERFQNCFEEFYLSHEINLRKPELSVYQFILETHKLEPQEVFFTDDTKENTDAALSLGFKVWNINPKTEDITELFTKHQHLL